MKNKYVIFRILGNDLQGLHGENQTLKNLEFTLKNEAEFPYTEKIYVLNRIFNSLKRQKIIDLLNIYNYKYIEIPFEKEVFDAIPFNHKLGKKIKTYTKSKRQPKLLSYLNYLLGADIKKRRYLIKQLYQHNLYLININHVRNHCLELGKEAGYEWSFVLDSNSYFTTKLFCDIIENIDDDTRYISIPQLRLAENNITNNQLLNNSIDFRAFTLREPQIAFHFKASLKFNAKIPYGTSEKTELLRVLQIPGPWSKWKDNELFLKIKDRPKINEKHQTLSKVIRLNPHNTKNEIISNYNNRIAGLYNLIEHIKYTE